MSENDISQRLDELAFSTDAPKVLTEISREYASSGKVAPEKVAELLGDRTRSVTMETTETIEQSFLGHLQP